MALPETYMNCGSHGAADTSRSTSSRDRLAARPVQHLVASGQLREETAVLPSSSSQPFILSGSPTECLELPIRSPDKGSYVTLIGYAGRVTYQRDFASIKKLIILGRVFNVPSRFAAVYPSGLSGFWVQIGF